MFTMISFSPETELFKTGNLFFRCLDVCGCPKVSERGIQALAKSCSRLEIIDLSSTKATDNAYVLFVIGRP